MRILEGDHQLWPLPDRPAGVTIGVYDGVHRGHQHVISALGERCHDAGYILSVVTFRRHPAEVLAPDRVPPLLTTLDQKLELFEDLGVQQVGLLDFDDDLRTMEADRFVTEVLVEALAVAEVSVGDDFRFGHRQRGDVSLLTDMGRAGGFHVLPVPLLGGSHPFRSTTIREALAAGDLDTASRALGRRFELRGTVVEGDRRGTAIGFPTANLSLADHQAVPGRGVYAVRAGVGEGYHPGVANVGVRPTFNGTDEVVEVHLLAGGRDLYGQELRVEFVQRIREEKSFSGVDALVAQIARDVETARNVLG